MAKYNCSQTILGKLVNQLNSDQAAQLHSIGSFLQQRRLELGVGLEEVAVKTRIRATLLQAIEDGNISLLPEPIYIKGMILRYGNILQVDGDTLADTFPLELTPVVSEIISPLPEPSAADHLADFTLSLKPHLRKILLWGGAILGLTTVVFLRQPLMEAIAKLRPNDSANSPANTKNNSTPPTLPAIVTQPSPSPVASIDPNSGVEATINLSADSWLQITIDGKVEFEGTLGRGTERKFVAKEKLSISAGNAGAVSVSVNREPPKPLGNPGEVKEAIFNASRQ